MKTWRDYGNELLHRAKLLKEWAVDKIDCTFRARHRLKVVPGGKLAQYIVSCWRCMRVWEAAFVSQEGDSVTLLAERVEGIRRVRTYISVSAGDLPKEPILKVVPKK